MASSSNGSNNSQLQTPQKPQFKSGSLVEVSSYDDGFRGSWYTGKVIKRASYKNPDKYLVEYEKLFDDDAGEKPVPPREKKRNFRIGEKVDAFHNDGWWKGSIMDELQNGKFAVFFRGTREQIVFAERDLRLHREWINGEWEPPLEEFQVQKKQKIGEVEEVVTVEEEDENEEVVDEVFDLQTPPNKTGDKPNDTVAEEFSKGMHVEVSSSEEGFEGAWFGATIIEAVGKDKYLIEYMALRTEDDSGFLREEIETEYIKPSPLETIVVDRFKLLDEVDALYNDGWWVGVISKVLLDCKYIVYFRESKEELMFRHSDLRPHQDWIAGQWTTPSLMSCSKVEKGNKAMPDGPCIENRQSEGHSSSEPQLDFAAMINNLTAPSLMKSTPEVGAKTPKKTSNVPVDTVNLTNSQSDNVLNNKNKDTMPGLFSTKRKLAETTNMIIDPNVRRRSTRLLSNLNSSPTALNPSLKMFCSKVEKGNKAKPDASSTASSSVGTPVSSALVGEGNANPTMSFGFTEIANMFGNEESSENEEESPSSDRILRKYLVKEALAPMIRSMLEKHGDIAANCHFETPKGRSVALEKFVEFIQTFKDKSFMELKERKIENYLKYVSEFGVVMGLEVGWLQVKLETVLRVRKTASQALLLKEKKDQVNQFIKDKKISLEIIEGELKEKKRSMAIIEEELKEKKRSMVIIKEELKEKKRSHDITKKELSALTEAQRLKATADGIKYYVDNPPFGDLF